VQSRPDQWVGHASRASDGAGAALVRSTLGACVAHDHRPERGLRTRGALIHRFRGQRVTDRRCTSEWSFSPDNLAVAAALNGRPARHSTGRPGWGARRVPILHSTNPRCDHPELGQYASLPSRCTEFTVGRAETMRLTVGRWFVIIVRARHLCKRPTSTDSHRTLCGNRRGRPSLRHLCNQGTSPLVTSGWERVGF
jgi:hypothetical protein